jgi:rod shape-determining protein MreC
MPPVYSRRQTDDHRPFMIMAAIAIGLTIWQHRAWRQDCLSLGEYLAYRMTAPVEAVAATVFGKLHDAGLAAAAAPNLAEENRRLREERDELRSEQIRTVDVHLQNRAFREKLGLEPTATFAKLPAEVIGSSSGGESRWVRVRVPPGRTLEVGNVVREARGLVGRVVEAEGNVGRVVLLVDPAHAVRGKDLRTGDEGMVHSAPELAAAPNRLRLEKVRRGAQLQAGDIIVTSDLGETYPGGVPIGVVESVRKTPASVTNLTAYIKPYVDFDRLDYVYVLRSGEK